MPAPPKGELLGNFRQVEQYLPLRGRWICEAKTERVQPACAKQKLSRSAALSQKAALQMPFAVTTPPVKMRLERPAGRDKREIINNSSAIDVQSAAEHILNRPAIGVQRLFFLHRNVLLIMVY